MVTIRVIKLDDSSLITDSKESLSNITDTSVPGWYGQTDSKNITLSMKDGVVVCNSSKQMTKSLVAQIKFQPQKEDGSVYLGKYIVAFDATNKSNYNCALKCNLSGNASVITEELVVNKEETKSFIFVFNQNNVEKYLTIKLINKIGKGTLELSNIHFIALAD